MLVSIRGLMVSVFTLILSGSIITWARVSPEQAAQLNTNLTPFGAERAGNAAGTIPAWTGEKIKVPAGYVPGGDHPNPFAEDQPLLVITAQNWRQYENQLTPGLIALFKTYPKSFQMKIYPSRRTHYAPDWVEKNTFANATMTKLLDQGNGVTQSLGGIPFPIPQNGLEAIWNHILRWRGVYVDFNGNYKAVVEANGQTSLQLEDTDVLFSSYIPGRTAEENEIDNRLFYYLAVVKAPAKVAGSAILGHEFLNQIKQPREAWVYEVGSRRVRRSPELGHSTVFPGTKGLATVDDIDIFNGSPDYYDWKIVSKGEIYIPYNNYETDNANLDFEAILTPGHLNPEYLRYELHRVWVVEANLKPGKRHIYKKRIFYLDEDSWQAVMADQYDANDQLWRISVAYLKNYFDMPGTWSALDAYYDLQSHRYYSGRLNNDQKVRVIFSETPPNLDRYSPSALRRAGRR